MIFTHRVKLELTTSSSSHRLHPLSHQEPLGFSLTKEKGRQEGQERGCLLLPLSFYFLIFLICHWLTQGSNVTRRRYNFLERHSLPFFCIQCKSWFEGEVWPVTTAHSAVDVMQSLVHTSVSMQDDLMEVYARGIPSTSCKRSPKGRCTHITCVCSHTCSFIPSDIT